MEPLCNTVDNVADDTTDFTNATSNTFARGAPTIWEEISICIEMPTFVWICLGYAGYSGAVIGFSTFGPAIAVGLGLWEDSVEGMTAASLAFSGTLAVSGILGTPMGGLMLDAWVVRDARKYADTCSKFPVVHC